MNIPIKENLKEITEVAEKAILRLEREYAIVCGADIEPIIRIAFTHLDQAVKYIAENRSDNKDGIVSSLNYYNLFTMGVSYREIADGEKEGNYTPFVKLSDYVINAFNKGESITREYEPGVPSVIKPSDDVNVLEKIGVLTYNCLKEDVDTRRGAIASSIAVIFFEELLNWLMVNHVTGEETIIGFSHIEFGVAYEDDKMLPFAAPKITMKTGTKNDDDTEDE